MRRYLHSLDPEAQSVLCFLWHHSRSLIELARDAEESVDTKASKSETEYQLQIVKKTNEITME